MPANESKLRNIIDMGFAFTVMARVFEKGTSPLIKEKLWEVLQSLDSIVTNEEFEKMHHSFCLWFASHVKLAKSDANASYGHAAKVLDVALKVLVYYCNLPNLEQANRLLPMLRCAIDTPIFKHLMKKYDQNRSFDVSSLAIKIIDENLYPYLQRMVVLDIEDAFNNNILPVQYDDVMWRRLNREQE